MYPDRFIYSFFFVILDILLHYSARFRDISHDCYISLCFTSAVLYVVMKVGTDSFISMYVCLHNHFRTELLWNTVQVRHKSQQLIDTFQLDTINNTNMVSWNRLRWELNQRHNTHSYGIISGTGQSQESTGPDLHVSFIISTETKSILTELQLVNNAKRISKKEIWFESLVEKTAQEIKSRL